MAELYDLAGTADVGVVGLGYVGLTLAVSLARTGLRVLGYDQSSAVVACVRRGGSPFFEPGLEEALASLPAGSLEATTSLSSRLPPVVVVCVGTPVDDASKEPRLDQLEAAIDAIGEWIAEDAVVVLRSTLPVGTTEGFVVPRLRRYVPDPAVAVCPERTIQGSAMRELRELPQVVGGTTPAAVAVASDLFGRLASRLVTVSSPAAAELVKIVCNCHTDVLYGFGNEIALLAGRLGLDATEVIGAANAHYPRPDIARPGFVGGSCLTKDPYLLMHAARATGFEPLLVRSARSTNEFVPAHIARRILEQLRAQGRDPATSTICIAGVAYKGEPQTDDVRGNAAGPLYLLLRDQVARVRAHDYVVAPERIRSLGLEPVELAEGCRDAHALAILVEHPRYRAEAAAALVASMAAPRVVYDLWGVWREQLAPEADGYLYSWLGSD